MHFVLLTVVPTWETRTRLKWTHSQVHIKRTVQIFGMRVGHIIPSQNSLFTRFNEILHLFLHLLKKPSFNFLAVGLSRYIAFCFSSLFFSFPTSCFPWNGLDSPYITHQRKSMKILSLCLLSCIQFLNLWCYY